MIPDKLPAQMADLYYRIAEIERRARNRKRKGTIAEIGTGENAGKYKVKLSQNGGREFVSDWIKSRVLGGGATKIDVMRAQGEQVDVISESGDLTDAEIDLSTYSDANARENGANVPFHLKIGDTVLAVSGDSVTVTAATTKIIGDVEIEGSVTITGASLTHNDKNVGSTHTHGGVIAGGDSTDVPNN
ncbi:hypothetical protein [Rhizobium laguerreae]|uniref:hypothetical protein n=1 Tax=Rhizobium laguerreae TaxID=1076926 RepID=UPI0021B13A93|nr:hypothetical protein [Rhizobium laguerreae]MBY3434824.1 hypothetical protein [Rhizobium laguerreae]MBY3448967.1 hypothetical protein [Rhizobium laguerreae]MBY3456741.1 hypothetical protein [Rhizobium laguerreae]